MHTLLPPMNPAIANGHVVTIHYRLTLDDGSIADESSKDEPLVYLHGSHNIVPGLERELAGKKVGDKCEVAVEPREGYGEYDPAAEQTVKRTAFPPNAQIDAGMAFQTRGRNGQPMTVWVRSIKGDDVTITANHPLAGQRLNFAIEVLDVRKATPQEKQHGHAHGAHGHDH